MADRKTWVKAADGRAFPCSSGVATAPGGGLLILSGIARIQVDAGHQEVVRALADGDLMLCDPPLAERLADTVDAIAERPPTERNTTITDRSTTKERL